MRLAYGASGVRLTVEDVGETPPHPPFEAPVEAPGRDPGQDDGGGYGLTGMRERAELLGGRMAAGPTATGFRVDLEVPV